MAALEVIALDTSVPQLMAPQAGDTYTFPRAVEMPLGTANGVLYLDGSKVVTSGSALTFDGSTLATTGALTVDGNVTLGNASTDTVQVNGYMGVGGAAATNIAAKIVNTTFSGSSSNYGVVVDITGASTATSNLKAAEIRASTAAASYTVTNLMGLDVLGAILGAGSTITNQYGVRVLDQTQGTNNYGISSLVSSGTNKWNIYASGTAANYFAGTVGIGAITTGTNFLEVRSSSGSGDIASSRDLLVAGENTIGRYLFGARSDASTYVYPSYIASLGAAAWSVSSTPTYMSFYVTSSGTTTPTERLRISPTEAVFNDPGNDYDFRVESDTNTHALFLEGSSGNVGIGTSSPAAKLHVSGVGNAEIARFTGTVSDRGLRFSDFAVGGSNEVGCNLNAPGASGVNGTLTFSTNSTERMRIDDAGNLIQTVNTTAATLTTNQTLTFSIVDNSTLRISVRGSDGTTRTATVALT